MTNTDQTPLLTAKESVDERACVLYTHMQHDSTDDKHQRTCGQNHMKAEITDQIRPHWSLYNPYERI
jgi:hypothetical protein